MSLIIIIILIILLIGLIYFLKVYDKEYLTLTNIDYLNDIPIFIINLKNRPERKEQMINELYKHNLTGTFIEAYNGKHINVQKLKNNGIINDDPTFRQLRAGEIGCYLSHLKCWELLLKSNYPYGLVLEDDCIFIDDFRKEFNDIFNHIKNMHWDIINLGRRCKPDWFNKDCNDGTIIYKYAFYPATVGYGLHAYIIKVDTIKKLLNIIYPITKPLDVIIPEEYDKGNIKVIGFLKDLATARNLDDSDTMKIK